MNSALHSDQACLYQLSWSEGFSGRFTANAAGGGLSGRLPRKPFSLVDNPLLAGYCLSDRGYEGLFENAVKRLSLVRVYSLIPSKIRRRHISDWNSAGIHKVHVTLRQMYPEEIRLHPEMIHFCSIGRFSHLTKRPYPTVFRIASQLVFPPPRRA